MKKVAIALFLVSIASIVAGFDGCNIDLSRTNGNQNGGQEAPAE